jgi:hypothetical protein
MSHGSTYQGIVGLRMCLKSCGLLIKWLGFLGIFVQVVESNHVLVPCF